MAACDSADPDGTVRLPFDVETGRLIDDVWERWLDRDPVRMVSWYRYPRSLASPARAFAGD